VKGDKTKGKNQKASSNGHSSVRDKSKGSHNNNLEDELGETDSDDTPSISSTTDSGTVSESESGKSSPPSSFPDPVVHHHHNNNNSSNNNYSTTASSTPEQMSMKSQHQQEQQSIIDANDMTTPLCTSSNEKILKDSGNLADTSGLCLLSKN
jgi:hypothetical protein